MDEAIGLDSGDHLIWQTNRGLLSPLYLPDPEKLLTLPPGTPQWRVYELNLGPNETQNITVNFGRRSWILALTGSFNQEEAFKANFFDATRKRAIFGNARELAQNLVGTAKSPAWLVTPYEIPPNGPLFIRVVNASADPLIGELVIYTHMEAE
jgi:hypothetical protein